MDQITMMKSAQPHQQTEPLLQVRDLVKTFGPRRKGEKLGPIVAVDHVSFTLEAGNCLAVVGESGSGKSSLARTLLRLIDADGGQVLYRGRDLLTLPAADMRRQRREIQMVFQDPYASLHPRRTVAQLISEPWEIHSEVLEKSKRHHASPNCSRL